MKNGFQLVLAADLMRLAAWLHETADVLQRQALQRGAGPRGLLAVACVVGPADVERLGLVLLGLGLRLVRHR